ncbi:uncharacterized protein BJ212DRAFT_1520941 [Suillus subaureus]|uniref:Uncharacterized protein n=1 Tax=Suillus subaureus TaxID=48587 RepID=A0A9P7E695_9AGAM|nr:uncharacterized protein BJ212DRAFT_1520941 [Suillus subaureus]KAG1811754.1 hypothetical protein BJ212DRAFT_1520941 [Suillus subaureus]
MYQIPAPQPLSSPDPQSPGALGDEGKGAIRDRAEESGNVAPEDHGKGKKDDSEPEENTATTSQKKMRSIPARAPYFRHRIWTELQHQLGRWEAFLEQAEKRLRMYTNISVFVLFSSVLFIVLSLATSYHLRSLFVTMLISSHSTMYSVYVFPMVHVINHEQITLTSDQPSPRFLTFILSAVSFVVLWNVLAEISLVHFRPVILVFIDDLPQDASRNQLCLPGPSAETSPTCKTLANLHHVRTLVAYTDICKGSWRLVLNSYLDTHNVRPVVSKLMKARGGPKDCFVVNSGFIFGRARMLLME